MLIRLLLILNITLTMMQLIITIIIVMRDQGRSPEREGPGICDILIRAARSLPRSQLCVPHVTSYSLRATCWIEQLPNQRHGNLKAFEQHIQTHVDFMHAAYSIHIRHATCNLGRFWSGARQHDQVVCDVQQNCTMAFHPEDNF